MSEILSQQEIDALLNASRSMGASSITPEEADAIGEIANISMGTASTTLSSLLNQKVTITTPDVGIVSLKDFEQGYSRSYIGVKIDYTEGLQGSNLMIIHEQDVKIITDLLMGGDGTHTDVEFNEMHLSAIGEVMNQMVGSAATSLANIFKRNINISPPHPFILDFTDADVQNIFDGGKSVRVLFKLVVGEIINSQIMQLLPFPFAKDMVRGLMDSADVVTAPFPNASDADAAAQHTGSLSGMQGPGQDLHNEAIRQRERIDKNRSSSKVNVQPLVFQNFDEVQPETDGKENIGLILDVPLQVTVEVGKTRKLIREILEFTAGSIIELDKQAGDPVDILVNGKLIAKGEVVVIDENFGVRITEMVDSVRKSRQE